MRKASILRFYWVHATMIIASNIAHPFTPTLIRQLGVPDSLFGMAYSAMSLSVFLFSPFWGKLSDKHGRTLCLLISCIGNGVGQFLFSIAKTSATILLARFIAGFFASGFMVSALAYVTDLTNLENRGKYLTFYAAINSSCMAFGYLVGGLLGDISIALGFAVQVILQALCGVLFFVMLKDIPAEERNRKSVSRGSQSINPIRVALNAKKVMTAPMGVFLVIVFFSSFGMEALDNAFNFFMKADLSFTPSYNGYVKAAVGVLSLLCNFTINLWIVKRFNLRSSMTVLFFLCSCSLIFICLVQPAYLLVGSVLVFFALYAIYIPMQQALIGEMGDQVSNGVLAGLFNSSKSLGMILGPLLAGLLYPVHSRLPFLLAALAYLAATILGAINKRQFAKTEDVCC